MESDGPIVGVLRTGDGGEGRHGDDERSGGERAAGDAHRDHTTRREQRLLDTGLHPARRIVEVSR